MLVVLFIRLICQLLLQKLACYFNKRHEKNQQISYSVTVQGVVDPNGVFTDICVEWPGSMTDDKVLEQSALYQRANMGLSEGCLDHWECWVPSDGLAIGSIYKATPYLDSACS